MRKKFCRELFEVTRVAKKFDRRTGTFVVNVSYKTKAVATPRTLAVAEAFGLGVDDFHEHVVYDNVELRIGPRDVVYVTGESGSGKSVLLRELERALAPDVGNIMDITVDGSKPLIDSVGRTFEEGLELLSRVGLNEAFLFVRRFRELSDGQKYRFRLAKMVESGRQYWVADEFCATLDRDTAKIVAFNVQKLARQLGKAVLVATTHTDLARDLKPSVRVHKRFGREIAVRYFPNKINERCSLVKDVRVEEGTRQDYKKLACFHYRSSYLPAPMRIFSLKHRAETVGVTVYSYSPSTCFGRRQALGRVVSVRELNRDFAWISRVVLHPKYRSIGLGAMLVRQTLPLVGCRYVETLAVMARYNPFFEKAGMTKIAERNPSHGALIAVEKLRKFGFDPVFLASEKTSLQVLSRLGTQQLREVKDVLLSVSGCSFKRLAGAGVEAKPFLSRREFAAILEHAGVERLALMLRNLSVLTQAKVYLFWRASECVRPLYTGGGVC